MSQTQSQTASPQALPKVLVYDSGLGGLSILDAIQRSAAPCELHFLSDNAAYPYGTKAEDVLVERVSYVLDHIQQQVAPDIIVVACNSASTVALPILRERIPVPIIGVVPAIKPAAQCSQSRVIGLLATPGTIQRHYTAQLVEQFASDCDIVAVGSSELVELAEQKLRGQPIAPSALTDILTPFVKATELDALVLACTHFPLLKPEMQPLLPAHVHWVDSGDAIARRVHYVLQQLAQQQALVLPATGEYRAHFAQALFTGPQGNPAALQAYLKQQECQHIEVLDLS